MKLLVFSDIHGNSYALESLLTVINRAEYDIPIFLGDVFGYYYNQHKVIESLGSLEGLIWLKGNHDDFFCRAYRGEISEEELIEKYGHSYENLKLKYDENIYELLNNKASSYTIESDKLKIGAFHGTPADSLNGRLYPKDQPDEQEFRGYDLVLTGHTHCRLVKTCGNTLIVNSGSLGQPRDGNGFGYCIVDTSNMDVKFYNVEIDRKSLYNQIDMFDVNLAKLKDVIERRKEDFQ